MNLYRDAWIPVRGSNAEFQQISLKRLLCQDEAWQISMPRDDMELACLQLLISLVQVAFTPADEKEWRQKMRSLLNEPTFDAGVAPLLDWFDLVHPVHPFMQTLGFESEKALPIQKLLIGLPEGHNHSFFNQPGEVKNLGAATAAISLFNQAVNSPGVSSGLEVGIRKAASVTLISANNLREMVWRNVLHQTTLHELYPERDSEDVEPPNWVKAATATEYAANMGLLRGLFWQPKCIQLVQANIKGGCDLLQTEEPFLFTGFKWKKQSRKLEGFWLHPHTPSRLKIDKDKPVNVYLSFTNKNPSWEHTLNYIMERASGEIGGRAAPVVTQWKRLGDAINLNLIVGGYCRKKSNEEKIENRRHELYSIGEGWQSQPGQDAIRRTIEDAIFVKSILRAKVHDVAKVIGLSKLKPKMQRRKEVPEDQNYLGMPDKAEEFFYQRTEGMIQDWFREMTRSERRSEQIKFIASLSKICLKIFEEVTEPYYQNPELIRTVALAKLSLNSELKKMKESIAQ
ncbi:MAG: type I-E CRISPR-associated protein Cse1/CasA [Burkholderiales bacterium]|nr:type I-E CRISPR-associated protein Cse1/CasA [Burkholderiales bacterium]